MNQPTTPLPDDWLTAYLDGELSDTERAQVEAWLAVDAAARARLEAMRVLGEDLRAVPRETLRAETSAKLMEALARWAASERQFHTAPLAVRARDAGDGGHGCPVRVAPRTAIAAGQPGANRAREGPRRFAACRSTAYP